jgi:hypothetical protein
MLLSAMLDRERVIALSSLPASARFCGDSAGPAGSGFCVKVEGSSLLPGGQTQGAGSLSRGSGNTSSPEPVIGYGTTKGTSEYRFVPRIGIPISELLPV